MKKGVLAKPAEWARHLRRDGKRLFWGKHRAKERRLCQKAKEERVVDDA